MADNFRTLKLLSELRNKDTYNNISYGVEKKDDYTMSIWKGIVIDKYGELTTLRIYCGKNYPKESPIVELVSTKNKKVHTMFIKKYGDMICLKKEYLKKWIPASNMAGVLINFKKIVDKYS